MHMKKLCFFLVLLVISTGSFSQTLRTTVKESARLYSWPDENANFHTTLSEGAPISVSSYINGFWRIKFPGINLRYYVADSCIVQLPIMDSIKKNSTKEYNQEEKQYFYQVTITKAEAEAKRKYDSIFDIKKRRTDSILAAENHRADSILQSKILLSKSRKIPLYLHAANVTLNSIGNPEANIIVANISNDTIDAYRVAIHCFNNFGEQVIHYSKGTNVFTGISQDKIYPSVVSDYPDTWTLYGLENTRKIKVYLISVHFTNGKTWTCPNRSWAVVEGRYQ